MAECNEAILALFARKEEIAWPRGLLGQLHNERAKVVLEGEDADVVAHDQRVEALKREEGQCNELLKAVTERRREAEAREDREAAKDAPKRILALVQAEQRLRSQHAQAKAELDAEVRRTTAIYARAQAGGSSLLTLDDLPDASELPIPLLEQALGRPVKLPRRPVPPDPNRPRKEIHYDRESGRMVEERLGEWPVVPGQMKRPTITTE